MNKILLTLLIICVSSTAYADGRTVSPASPANAYADYADAITLAAAEDYTDAEIAAATANMVTEDRTITVAASGGDYTSIADAVDYLNTLVVTSGAHVTLSIAAGVYAETKNTIALSSTFASSMSIVGAALDPVLGKNSNQIYDCTGSAGAWSVTLSFSSGAFESYISEGDYIKVLSAVTPEIAQVSGFWPVTDVDTTNHRLTFTCLHALDLPTILGSSFPMSAVVTVKNVPTLITSTMSAADDYIVGITSPPALIQNIGLVAAGENGAAINFDGSGSTSTEVYLYGNTAVTTGMSVASQVYLDGLAYVSGFNTGVSVVGGTAYLAAAVITGSTNGVYSAVNGLVNLSAFCSVQGCTTGATGSQGGTVLNGYGSFVMYNGTGATVSDFSKFGNVVGGVLDDNTVDAAQTINTLLADGSYILVP